MSLGFSKRDTGICWLRASVVLFLFVFLLLVVAKLIYSRKNRQFIEFDAISGPILNPLMGWSPWATIKESMQPHTLVYADLTWREFEPEQGYYDFDAFEKQNQLDRWRKEGKRVVFRFVADKPGDHEHLDIPDWLFDAMNGSGDFYDNNYGKGFSPDYSDQIFIDNHKRAIDVLGQRYGTDDFIAFIELGSLGHWGEWHVNSDVQNLPGEDLREMYVLHYVEAFPNTFLLMRRPFSIARELNLGLYNDMTGDPISTATWLDWISNGGEYDQTKEADALVVMSDSWQKVPIGGEQAPSVSDEEFYGDELARSLELLSRSHTTFIGPNGPYEVEVDGPLQKGIDQALSTLGYRIYINQVQMPRWVYFENNITVQIEFSNDGAAPLYYNWPMDLYLFDEGDKVVTVHRLNIDVRKILPGKSYAASGELPINNLKAGQYTVGIAILDPLTNQPAVRLAMQNDRQDLIYEIGSFEVFCILNCP